MIPNPQAAPSTEMCWYCKKNSSDKRFTVSIPIHNIIDAEYKRYGNVRATRYNFQQADVAVPRCENCHNRQKTQNNIILGITIVSFVGGLIILLFAAATAFHWTNSSAIGSDLDRAGIMAIIGVILWVIAGNVRKISDAIFTAIGSTKPESFGSKSPNIQKMLSDGWQVGKKP